MLKEKMEFGSHQSSYVGESNENLKYFHLVIY